MAATFDRLSGGRLLINVVTGGDPAELEGDGVFLDHDTRYEVTDEFLHIWRELLDASHTNERSTSNGKHLTSKGGKVLYPPVQKPHPPLWFGGSSAAAHEIGGRADRHVPDLGRAARRGREEDRRRSRARRAQGRTIKFGIRLHVIVRETEDEAWAAADKLISKLDDETIAARAGALREDGFRRPAPHGRAARRQARRTRRARGLSAICGPASASCAAVRARRWSAIRSRSPRA